MGRKPSGVLKRLAFDEPDSRFELLETEKGTPRSFRSAMDEEPTPPKRGRRARKRRREGKLPRSVKKVSELMKEVFCAEDNSDVILREFKSGSGRDMLLVYMNGMADDGKINEFILKPLMECEKELHSPEGFLENAVEIAEAKIVSGIDEVETAVLEGMTAVFSEGEARCLLLETRGFEKRAVQAPENENIVLGPKESFTESMRTNITLLRRLIHTGDLAARIRPAGSASGAKLAVIYREGVTNRRLVEEVMNRLDGIDTSTIPTTGVIEQLIEDKSVLPIPRTLSTERPDRAASHIMQGRVCLIVEGSPLAAVMPITFFSLMDSPEDVYMRKPLGSVLRVVRYLGAFVSVMLPGYFLALALYHQGMLTTEVLSTVIASRKMVFEPIAVEMILLLLIFQLIREAGLRVPGAIGQAIGIIGGLIMGQAAVTAHLASSVVLIIVAASGLGNFCIPDYSTQIAASYVRMAMVIAAWIGGLLAMLSAGLLLICLLADIKSFGVPFLSPFSPKTKAKRPFILRGGIGSSRRADDYANTETELKKRR